MKQLLLIVIFILFTGTASQAVSSDYLIVSQSIQLDIDDEFTLLTNPINDGTLKLRVNKTDTKNVSITVINSIGEQVFNAKSVVNKPVLDFDISKLAAGIYFLRIQSDAHSTVKKLIVQ